MKSQQMTHRKKFFNSSLYHLIQKNNRVNSSKLNDGEEIKELKIKKAPIIVTLKSPSPSPTSTMSIASSKQSHKNNSKLSRYEKSYKLPFIRAPNSSTSSVANTSNASDEGLENDVNHYTSYLYKFSENVNNNQRVGHVTNNRTSKVSFKLDK